MELSFEELMYLERLAEADTEERAWERECFYRSPNSFDAYSGFEYSEF